MDSDTRKYIQDVFIALQQPWTFLLDDELISKYEIIIPENYDTFCSDTFRRTVENNKRLFAKMPENW